MITLIRECTRDGVWNRVNGVESRARPQAAASRPAFTVRGCDRTGVNLTYREPTVRHELHARRRLPAHRLLLMLAVLLAASALNAADQGRSVRGRVTDQAGEPLRGAVVQVKNASTLQIRSYITQEDGKYKFHRLRYDVDYKLNARYSGQASKTRTLNWHDSRREANINFKIRLAEDVQQSSTAFLTDAMEHGSVEFSKGGTSE